MRTEEERQKYNDYQNKFYHDNREKILKQRVLLRKKNKEKIANWNKAHREQINKAKRLHWEKNKEKHHKQRNEYYKNNSHKVLVIQHKRRVACKETDITPEFLDLIWESTWFCCLCGVELANHRRHPNGKHLDHILPICAGGKNMKNNVRYICAKCNVSRPRDGRDLIQGIAV